MSRMAERISALTCWVWSESRARAWSSEALATSCSPRSLTILQDRDGDLTGCGIGAVRVAEGLADVAEVAGDADDGETVVVGGFARRFGGL